MKFLEGFNSGTVIYFDADRNIDKIDMEKLLDTNIMDRNIIDRLVISIPKNWRDVLDEVGSVIRGSKGNEVMIIVDSLPSIFLGEQRLLLKDLETMRKKKVEEFTGNIISFMMGLRHILRLHNNAIFILLNQLRGRVRCIDKSFWASKGYIPAFWNLIQGYTDACILLEKIRRGLLYVRVIFSYFMPEVLGIIKMAEDLKIS